MKFAKHVLRLMIVIATQSVVLNDAFAQSSRTNDFDYDEYAKNHVRNNPSIVARYSRVISVDDTQKCWLVYQAHLIGHARGKQRLTPDQLMTFNISLQYTDAVLKRFVSEGKSKPMDWDMMNKLLPLAANHGDACHRHVVSLVNLIENR